MRYGGGVWESGAGTGRWRATERSPGDTRAPPGPPSRAARASHAPYLSRAVPLTRRCRSRGPRPLVPPTGGTPPQSRAAAQEVPFANRLPPLHAHRPGQLLACLQRVRQVDRLLGHGHGRFLGGFAAGLAPELRLGGEPALLLRLGCGGERSAGENGRCGDGLAGRRGTRGMGWGRGAATHQRRRPCPTRRPRPAASARPTATRGTRRPRGRRGRCGP